jgi:hypothetical protein
MLAALICMSTRGLEIYLINHVVCSYFLGDDVLWLARCVALTYIDLWESDIPIKFSCRRDSQADLHRCLQPFLHWSRVSPIIAAQHHRRKGGRLGTCGCGCPIHAASTTSTLQRKMLLPKILKGSLHRRLQPLPHWCRVSPIIAAQHPQGKGGHLGTCGCGCPIHAASTISTLQCSS